MTRTAKWLPALGLVLATAPPASFAAPAAPPKEPSFESRMEGMRFRYIGPFRGGRVTAVAGVRGQRNVAWQGATGGGVWKTTDGGTSWEAVSDKDFRTGSVGAVAVAESDPNVVWVGMGEAPIRGNVSHGDGVWRSTDAGRTWKHLGLAATQQISALRVHPKDPDVAWVAAQGKVWGPSEERGVYRTKDGGRTWTRILFVDANTGASDLSVDPSNPRILYAGMWQVVRRPWELVSGGAGSSLFRSDDGGDTWKKLAKGLPEGTWGKVGVAASGARPGRVWALVEAEKGGLFRSDDWGESFTKVNEENDLRQRAWYYTGVYADPKSAETVWVTNVQFWKSVDGGKSFASIPTPHGDHHDLWIDPDDPAHLLVGDDGGAYLAYDGGRTWSSIDNQPTGQFYRVVVDDRFPYRVYGAQQDNTTVAIASRARGREIGREEWHAVGGCESGWIAPKPGEPDVVYAGCYGGSITRYDHRTGEEREITAWPQLAIGRPATDLKYRIQWNAPILVSRHDPNVLWHAAQLLLESRDEGQSWKEVSPDLTRNDRTKQGSSGGPITKDNTGVEVYGTIFALAESRLEKGLLWAGSDDGLVHVTRDGGATWKNVTPKGLPEWTQVNSIEASPARRGHGVPRRDALQARRLHPAPLEDGRFRGELDADRRRHSPRCLHARRPRGSREARPPLRRNRDGPFRLVRRREGLDPVPAEPPGRADHRPRHQGRRSRRRDAGARLLDPGRHLAAPAVARRRGRGQAPPVRAPRRRPLPGRRRPGETSERSGAEPSSRRGDLVLGERGAEGG